jgi:hypothetical protein
MTRKTPPGKEECLKSQGEGCHDCESRGTHGGHSVCRRQVAGKYNRQIFYNRGDSSSRPQWCPKNTKNARKGYATSEPLPKPEGEGIKSPGPQHQTGKVNPMPLNPKTHLERRVPRVPHPEKESTDEQVIKPAPKEPKLKRKAKDAPWGVTEDDG